MRFLDSVDQQGAPFDRRSDRLLDRSRPDCGRSVVRNGRQAAATRQDQGYFLSIMNLL